MSYLKCVVLNMRNYLMSQAIEQSLKREDVFDTIIVEHPEQVAENCRLLAPDVLLMEVAGYASWRLEERLALREQVKSAAPGCKVALIVDENTEKEVAKRVKKAKMDGLIDLFIYGSTSINFLIALMETL